MPRDPGMRRSAGRVAATVVPAALVPVVAVAGADLAGSGGLRVLVACAIPVVAGLAVRAACSGAGAQASQNARR